MSLSKIEKLTPEQEALIPVYREKWRQIALSTERLDRAKAESVIKAAYIAIGKPEPEVQFYSSPCVVRKSLSCYWQHYLVDILPPLIRSTEYSGGFQRLLFRLPLSSTRLTLRSFLTNAEVDVSRGVSSRVSHGTKCDFKYVDCSVPVSV